MPTAELRPLERYKFVDDISLLLIQLRTWFMVALPPLRQTGRTALGYLSLHECADATMTRVIECSRSATGRPEATCRTGALCSGQPRHCAFFILKCTGMNARPGSPPPLARSALFKTRCPTVCRKPCTSATALVIGSA